MMSNKKEFYFTGTDHERKLSSVFKRPQKDHSKEVQIKKEHPIDQNYFF